MKRVWFMISGWFLAIPLVVAAQVRVDPPSALEPVPVPYNLHFFLGPAGRRTASGLIIGLIDIALAIAGMIAVLYLIVGGVRYITAHGNEEQAEGAKKTITHAIIGLVIIILSFVIIQVISNALVFGGTLGT